MGDLNGGKESRKWIIISEIKEIIKNSKSLMEEHRKYLNMWYSILNNKKSDKPLKEIYVYLYMCMYVNSKIYKYIYE